VAELQFTFHSKSQENEPFFVQLRRFAAQNGWLPGVANEVELIFEEWLTNVRSYGLAGRTNPQVRVTLRTRGRLAELDITDNGIAFDPTLQKDPDLNAPVEERPIGGLGIFMMKKLSSRMRYQRSGEWNQLVIEKDLAKPVLSPRT
jgi:serine/threonine-protein kinase RsbW